MSGNIPPIATELRAIVRMSNKQSADLPAFPFRWPLHLFVWTESLACPKSRSTFLNNCLLSSGKLDIPDILAGQEVGVNLDAIAADVSADSCPDSKPVLGVEHRKIHDRRHSSQFFRLEFTQLRRCCWIIRRRLHRVMSPNPLEFSVELRGLCHPSTTRFM